MSGARLAFVTAAHDESEGEALLHNESRLSEQDDVAPSLRSMPARVKTALSGEKALTVHAGDGSELALDNLGTSHHLDDAYLRAQGHEAALQRSFSPLAALGLGFR